MKKLVLHIGHGKTGTSAIQSFCARHQGKLRSHGIDYPHHPSFDNAIDGKITSGNINPRKEGWLDTIKLVTEASAAETVLFSNEDMFHIIARDWAQFCAMSKNFNIQVILFVRDPVEMLLSSYGQAVKREGHIGTLEDFWPSEDHTAKACRILKLFQDEGIPVKLRNYSMHKTNVIEAFLGCLLKDLSDFRDDFDIGTINRSLTNGELAFQMAFNRHFGKESASFVSDVLVTKLPHMSPENSYLSRKSFETFTNRLGVEMDHLNKALPSAEQISFLNYEKYKFAASEQVVEFTPEQIDVLATAISNKIRDIEKYFESVDKFEPQEYIDLNPDLKNAEMPMFKHFVKHGIKERRQYKK